MKKHFVKSILLICTGIMIGVFGAWYYFGYSYQKIRLALAFEYLTYSEKIAFDAYKNESPEISRWAIERHIDTVNHYKKKDPFKDLIDDNLLIQSYLVLAKLYKAEGNEKKYNDYMSRALKIAQIHWKNGNEVTHEMLIEYLEKFDSLTPKVKKADT